MMTPIQIVVAYLSLLASPIIAGALLTSNAGWDVKIVCLFIMTGLAATTYCRIRDHERG